MLFRSVVTRNLISTGNSGINLAFVEAQQAVGVEVSYNTFHNLQIVLGLPGVLDQGIRIDSNLVVESNGPLIDNVPVDETKLPEIRGWFHNNWWERNSSGDNASLRELMQIVTYVPLSSREWGTPEFLVPAKRRTA